jgi:hypothetical protein
MSVRQFEASSTLIRKDLDMPKDLPIYKIEADSVDTEMVGIAIVDIPAHLKKAYVFSGESKPRYFADAKRGVIFGVAIAADELIYRNDQDGEYYVFFDADTIWNMRLKLMRTGQMNNVNLMHTDKKVDATLLDSFIVDSKMGIAAPEVMADQNLKEGSWIVSYKVDDPAVLAKVEKGELNGWSIEAFLDMKRVEFSQHNQNKTNKLDLLAKIVFDKI